MLVADKSLLAVGGPVLIPTPSRLVQESWCWSISVLEDGLVGCEKLPQQMLVAMCELVHLKCWSNFAGKFSKTQ